MAMLARLSRHLGTKEIARLLRDDPDDGRPVTKLEAKNALNKLRRVERDTRTQILFGGGYRDGKTRRGKQRVKGGGKLWTTWSRLRHAGLVDDHLELFALVGARVGGLEDRVAVVDEQQRLLAKALGAVQRDVARLQGKLAYVLARLPKPGPAGTNRSGAVE